MDINIDDIETIRRLLEALGGDVIRRVEAETTENKIVAYCVGDNQVRIDIVGRRRRP